MISSPEETLRERAEKWRSQLEMGEVVQGRSAVGGGSLPEETLPTALLAFKIPKPDRFVKSLRSADPPIIARIEKELVLFDSRTVLPEQDEHLLSQLKSLLSAG